MDEAPMTRHENTRDVAEMPTSVIASLTQSLLASEGNQQADVKSTTAEYIFFDCGEQRWGAHLKDIWQIVPRMSINLVAVPLCPTWVMGAFQTEMQIATLIHLAEFMKIPPQTKHINQQEDAVLIIKDGADLFGLHVSRISNSYYLAVDELDMIEINSELHRQYPYAIATIVATTTPEMKAQGILDAHYLAVEIGLRLKEVSRNSHA